MPVLTAAQSIDLVEHRIDGITSWVENDSIMDSMNNVFSINRSEESTVVRIKILKNSYGKVNKSYEFDLEGLAITNGTEI